MPQCCSINTDLKKIKKVGENDSFYIVQFEFYARHQGLLGFIFVNIKSIFSLGGFLLRACYLAHVGKRRQNKKRKSFFKIVEFIFEY